MGIYVVCVLPVQLKLGPPKVVAFEIESRTDAQLESSFGTKVPCWDYIAGDALNKGSSEYGGKEMTCLWAVDGISQPRNFIFHGNNTSGGIF